MPDRPTGTVTFLFTDIEGSTKLWEQYPEAMQPALARHDAILRGCVESNRGYIVKMRGDGIHAAFATASDALVATLAIQRALCLEFGSWKLEAKTNASTESNVQLPISKLQLRVRCALHTGAVEERDGDYFGASVNRAARLLSAGHGGQILLSLATQELIRDHLPEKTSLRDLGERRLKDLIRPERIFQVVALDLPADFPPLLTLDSRPNNLPAQTTPLVGREKELEVVGKLLRRADVRLVTLSGPGGTGKTRLCLQVAADLFDGFADGVYFVNLAPVRDPALVVSSIAQTLGVRESGGRTFVENLKHFLCDKQILLLLDNFEQVVSAAFIVAELLECSSALKILVTSRETLRVRGEHEYPVPPLALPDAKHLPSAERLAQYAAVALFVQRALAVRPDFTVTDQNAPSIAEICVRLDGLPLAIELAAARCKVLAPPAILARLESRLALLTSDARDLPARHQTLRDAIGWSYDLLDDGERNLFARLAVFMGGCTLQAAEAVCGEGLPTHVLNGVQSLVDKSLLQLPEGEGGEPRLQMLETIREYALEKLEASNPQVVRRQHAGFFWRLAEQAEPNLTGAEQALWLERLGQDHDNLRAALAWFFENGEIEAGAGMAAAVWQFWRVRGYFTEARQWLERGIKHGGAFPIALRAKLLHAAGSIARLQGEHAQAQTYLQECLALRRGLSDLPGVADTLNALGILAQAQGDYLHAQQRFQEGLALRRELGDRAGAAIVMGNLGVAFQNQGDHTRAAELYAESLSIKRELGDKVGIVVTLNNLGSIALLKEEPAKAKEFLSESLRLARELGDKQNIGISLNSLGNVALLRGDVVQGRLCHSESLSLFQQLGYKEGIAWGLEGMAAVAGAERQATKGARLYGAAQAFRNAACLPLMPGDRAVYDSQFAVARAQLDDAAFEAAWAEGRAMTLDQAIAYALEVAEPQ